jgi:hypothetical protein
MQEMNCIHLSRSDYPAISNSVILPTPAPGLKNSRDIASIVVSLCANNALPLPYAAEHNLPQAGENVGIPAEFLNASQSLPEKKWQKVTSLCRYLVVGAHANNITETLTMTSNEIQIELQTDYQIGLTRTDQQCNWTRTRTTGKEEKRKSPRFAFLKISAIAHCTHLQFCRHTQ